MAVEFASALLPSGNVDVAITVPPESPSAEDSKKETPVSVLIQLARTIGIIMAIGAMLTTAFGAGVYMTVMRSDINKQGDAIVSISGAMKELTASFRAIEPKVTQNSSTLNSISREFSNVAETLDALEPQNQRYGKQNVIDQYLKSRENFDRDPNGFWLAKPE